MKKARQIINRAFGNKWISSTDNRMKACIIVNR